MKNHATILILALSPLLLMFFHIIIVRSLKALKINFSSQLSLFACEILLNIPVLITVYMVNKSVSSLVYSFIVYNCLGYCYFHVFNMSETARRIKVLLEIDKGNSVNITNLNNSYTADLMIKNRLVRLTELKQVRKDNDKYILANRVLWISSLINHSFRRILGYEKK